jgi:plasmid stabilization system protein ParE
VPRLIILDDARDDLASIGRDILASSRSPEAALRFTEQLVAKCKHLAGLPGTLGRARPELLPGMRSFAFKSYVIFFRYGGARSPWDTLEVINILEGRRDFIRYFQDDPDEGEEG